jgi:hypothetical protein
MFTKSKIGQNTCLPKTHGKKKEQQAATKNKLNLILEMWDPLACNIQCLPLNRITSGRHKIEMIQLTDVFSALSIYNGASEI